MPRQGLSGLTAAKVQQKNELTKYFGKKVQILYKKNEKTRFRAKRWVPAFNLSPLTFNLKNSKLKT